MRPRFWTTLFLVTLAQFAWGQTNANGKLVSEEATAPVPSANSYVVLGATPQQEALVRGQIRVMQPTVLPLRILFVPHWKYIDTARTFRLHAPPGYTSAMFTHLPSRSVFVDSDRYVCDGSLGYWMAHELGHLASNSTREEDAEKAAREYRKRLKQTPHAGWTLQSTFTQTQDPSGASAMEVHEIPLELWDGFLIVVEGRISQLKGLKFILDTGASYSVVDRRVAEQFALQRRPGKIFNFDKYIPVEMAEFADIQFGPVEVQGASLMIADLVSSSLLHQHADAIIGLGLLCASRGLLIDYEARRVLFHSKPSDNPASPQQCPPSLTMDIMVQGHPARLSVDTGMEGILLYEDRLRKRFPQLRIEDEVQGVQVGYLRVKRAKLPGVWLGSTESAPTVFLLKGLSKELADIDGYLGTRALNARQVEFNFEAKTLAWRK